MWKKRKVMTAAVILQTEELLITAIPMTLQTKELLTTAIPVTIQTKELLTTAVPVTIQTKELPTTAVPVTSGESDESDVVEDKSDVLEQNLMY